MIDWLKRAQIDPEIELNGECIPIVLKRHRTAKRLTLRLAPDASEVRITLPRWANAKEALAFAHARSDWLSAQYAKIPKREAVLPGSALMIDGEPVTLAWDADKPRTPALNDAQLQVGGPQEGLEGRVKRWLEKRALALFEQDTEYYCCRGSITPAPVGLSRAQKRWGSCSEQKRIRINWRLVQAPQFVRRSVVAHEVTHLVHFDHSPAFYALLDNIYDGDIKDADLWLKQNGRSLYSAFG